MSTIYGKSYSSPKNINLKNGILRFDVSKSSNPLSTDSVGWGLYVDGSNRLCFWNKTDVTVLGAASAGGTTSWDQIFAIDEVLALTTAAWTITQAGNFGDLILTKSGTGAGVPLVINNAGTGNDLNIVNTNAEAVGVKISTDAQSASAADADTVFYLSVNGYSDNGTAREYGFLKFIATDTGNASEDTTITMNEMIAGTARDVFTLTGPLLTLGYGAAMVITSRGAYNLTLETNSGTNSGLITIVDDANGDIQLTPNGSGVIAISTGITAGSTTPTACIFGVAGSSGAGTTGYGVKVNATTLTTGTALLVDSAVSSSGLLLDLQLATVSVFKVSEAGALTVAGTGAATFAGTAGANSLILTAGDAVLSDGSLTITDADAAVTLIVTNSTATTLGAAADTGIVSFVSESLTTGALLSLSLDETNLTTGWYLRCFGQDAAANVFSVGEYGATIITTAAAATSLTIATATTNVDAVSISGSALTTGDLVYLESTAETLAAGEILKIVNTESGNAAATPKTGNLCSITSSVTQTTASATFDYDTLLISRSNIANADTFTLTASGSVLKLMNTSTNTAGTCTDTTVILEILAADGGTAAPTGDCAKITSVGVGAKALNIVSASTTVSDVLITGSGVKASTKAVAEITSSGATAAGGAVLRVSASGVPAAATSYLAVFTNAGATVAANPVCVYINAKDSTAAALQITGSGASAGGMLELNSTAGGALGAVLKFNHTPGANAEAAGDVVARILFTGQDDADAEEVYGRIDCVLRDAAAAAPDASLVFYADKAGTNTQLFALGWDTVNGATLNGALVGDGAATAIISSQGAYDLTINTNGGTASGYITITDGATGDITIVPGTTSGQIQLTSPSYGQVTAGADGAATLTIAMCGLYTIGNTVARTLTLPAVAGSAGLWYTIKKTTADAAAVTIDTPGAETIDGAATNAECDAQYDAITIVSDGSNWHIVSKKIAA